MPVRVAVSRIGAVLGGAPGADDDRAFLQSRLAFLGRAGSAAFAGLYVLRLLAHPRPANHILLVALALFLATAMLCQGGRRSWACLARVDALLMPTLGVLLALLTLSLSPRWAWDGVSVAEPLGRALVFPLVMGGTFGIVARAVVVPSDPRRTLWVSLATALPVAVGAWAYNVTYPGGPPLGEHPLFSALAETVWILLAVALAVMTSRITYGLREAVREARQLGQYTLEEKIGGGGMGEIYRARHALLRRPVALKLLPPELVAPAALERFEREVQMTALLTHPNTVAIYDYGHTSDGVFYYVMEMLDGVDLERLVEDEGPQPPARVVHVLRQVAGSLAEAHGLGLVHRDVKPANVVLTRRGGLADVVKVVDFGLVKDLGAGEASRLTADDTITGTPLYLAPEAIRSAAAVDARSDLYALGAVGFYVLTGTPVFPGQNVVEVCAHHLHTPAPAPSERLGRPLPPALEKLLLECLKKDPARRPPTALALQQRLERLPDVPEWTQKEALARWEEHVSRCALPPPADAVSPGTPGRR